jgi:arylsulfatase A-like enzyme
VRSLPLLSDAVKLIGAQGTKTPFFLYLAFNAPHAPYQAPQADLDRYQAIPDPRRRAYAAQITAMDSQIGRVVTALDERKMRDDTLIVFQSETAGRAIRCSRAKATCPRSRLPSTMAPIATARVRSASSPNRLAANQSEDSPTSSTISAHGRRWCP